MPGLNTSDPSGRALLLDLAFQPTLVALAGVDDEHNDGKSLEESSHNYESILQGVSKRAEFYRSEHLKIEFPLCHKQLVTENLLRGLDLAKYL